MAILLIQALVFAVLLSGITLAVFGASLGNAGLLSPIRIWLERFGKSELLQNEVFNALQNDHDAKYSGDKEQMRIAAAVLKYAVRIEARYALWRKPLLLCAKCMPSVWGILLSLPMCIWYDLTIPAALIGICFSSLFNTKLQV